MKKTWMSIVMLTAVLSASAQLSLNTNGEYELKVTEQYSGASAKTLYENTLVALADITNQNFVNASLEILRKNAGFNDTRLSSLGMSRFISLDVADKEAGLIVCKGSLFIEYSKSRGHSANYILKIRCKDGRVQYDITVPSVMLVPDGLTGGTVPLKYLSECEIKMVANVKEKLFPQIGPLVKSFQQDIVKQTKVALANDF